MWSYEITFSDGTTGRRFTTQTFRALMQAIASYVFPTRAPVQWVFHDWPDKDQGVTREEAEQIAIENEPIPPPLPIEPPPLEEVPDGEPAPYAIDNSTGTIYKTKEDFLNAGFVVPIGVTGANPFAGGYDPATGQGLPFKRTPDGKEYKLPSGGIFKAINLDEVIIIDDT